MTAQKGKKQEKTAADDSRHKINTILDQVVRKALEGAQLDSFYKEKAVEVRGIAEDCFSCIARKFQKAGVRERYALLEFLKHYQGVEVIQFLQDFVRRESFQPRLGMAILEQFNRSDAILEEGLASRLLDLDQLVRRLQLALEHESFDDQLMEDFSCREDREKEGILRQILEESGTKTASLIVKLFEADEKSARRALATLSAVSDVDSYAILKGVYDQTGRKDIFKLLKKVQHALGQKGVEVSLPEVEEQGPAVFRKAALPGARAFISTIDAEGYRLLFMVKPVSAYENKIFNFMLSDSRGINDIEVVNALRRESQAFVNKLLKDKKTEFMETTIAHAAFLVQEAIGILEARGAAVPATIAQWNSLFEDQIGVMKQPAVYDCIGLDDVRGVAELDETVEQIFSIPDILFWFVMSEEAKENWLRITNVMYSTLVLSDAQKKERIYGLQVETAKAFFTESRLRAMKRRLEEISYFLYKKGQELKARAALAVASTLAAEDMQTEKNTFCMEMINRGFRFFEASYEKDKKKKGSMIVGRKDLPKIV